jgi:hypothetical protein
MIFFNFRTFQKSFSSQGENKVFQEDFYLKGSKFGFFGNIKDGFGLKLLKHNCKIIFQEGGLLTPANRRKIR